MSRDLPEELYDEESDGVRRTVDAEGNVFWWEYINPETHRIIVDGQLFEVSRRNDRSYGYEWLDGRDPAYGFAATAHASGGETGSWELTDEEHAAHIRDFLAQVDPQTGYLED